uniref:Cellulose synthase n=1 Tax=Rhizophora mucronata TaxID=61149 RepID=A0A2P2JA54_RHIMU
MSQMMVLPCLLLKPSQRHLNLLESGSLSARNLALSPELQNFIFHRRLTI